MTLQELMQRIVMSSPGDWHRIGGFPSYRDKFTLHSSADSRWVEVEPHDAVAAYKPDVSITMAWGITVHADFQEPWANKFPDPSASSHLVDVFYNGALVFRTLYVSVDGARAMVPLSRSRDELVVPAPYYAFVTLLDSLSVHVSRASDYFDRAGLRIIDAPWPEEIMEG